MLTLNGSGSYSGGTTIIAGTLQMGNVIALPSTGGVTVNSGGVFDFNGFALTNSPTFTLGGSLVNTSATAVTYPGSINTVASTSPAFGGVGNLTLTGAISTRNGSNFYKIGNDMVTIGGSSGQRQRWRDRHRRHIGPRQS